jgi:hypothetical protein
MQVRSQGDLELVAENEVLEGDVTPGPDGGKQTAEK